MKCPNCHGKLTQKHITAACLLAAVAGVARDRGNLTPAQITARMRSVDDAAFWAEAGEVVSRFEAGLYAVDRPRRCDKCQDRPGFEGLGRLCKGCSGTGYTST